MMRFFDSIYRITFYENGKFCFKTTVIEKTIENYRADNVILFVTIILLSVCLYNA